MENACADNGAAPTDQQFNSNIYIGRQPIFDRSKHIFAYELLYRDSKENRANIRCQNESTCTVILNLLTDFGFTNATSNKIAFINLSKDHLTGEKPVDLPAEKVVLEILEDTVVDDDLITGLNNLLAQGYSLALDDFIYSSEWDAVLPLVEYIKVEVSSLSRDEIKEHVLRLKNYNVKLLAEKIESEEEYEYLRECGFDLFQGYFLARPKVIEGRTIPANKQSILLLLSDLNNNDVEVDELVRSISKDVSLCYKILRYINSAHYALVQKVESIHDAITFVGLRKLKHWAALIAVSNLSDRPDDFMQLTMVRAHMCEQIAVQQGKKDTDEYFSIGLLSALDILLGYSMHKILKTLPLSNEMQCALLDYQGCTGHVLACVKAYEKGEWDAVSSLDIGLDAEQLRDCFFVAMQLASDDSISSH